LAESIESTDLLKRISADPVEAERRLINIRRKLLDFFRWNLSRSPEDLVQETLRRVAVRARDPNTKIHVPIENYCFGVARYVLWESRESDPEIPFEPEQLNSLRELTTNRSISSEEELLYNEFLKECLKVVSQEDIDLVQEYRVASAAELAEELFVTETSIRLRVFRTRKKLREVVRRLESRGSAKQK
jgi:DNA-directed RNA polymerase specialized sigma24 family protein